MGRGDSGLTAGGMNVDWDKWGKTLDGADAKYVYDKDGNVIGSIRDELRFTSVPEERSITRAEIMKDISGWRNDDGSYGDEDTTIFVAYDDGTFFASDMVGVNGYRDKLKKTGVIGASIMTPDYEMVWGGERNSRGDLVPYTTHFDDEGGGKSNTYSGYKITGQYRVRVKRWTERLQNGRYQQRSEIIRKSKVRKVDW